MHINCFNRSRFLAEVSTSLQKYTIFGNLRSITEERKKETRQMTLFSSPFWALTVCDFYFCIQKLSKFIFMWSPLWSILVCKISDICRWKLQQENFVFFDSGNMHIQESKKAHWRTWKKGFTFSIKLRTKFVWSHGLWYDLKCILCGDFDSDYSVPVNNSH